MLNREQARETAAAIADLQAADGCIPWEDGRHADPWNHIEAAMALDVGGRHADAERAYRWLQTTQRGDGSWACRYRQGAVEDAATDANFCAYVATGAWHHFLASADCRFLHDLWPTVEAALESVLTLQQPDGRVWWARDGRGRPWPGALITSSASIHKSLECGVAIAHTLGHARPAWRAARGALGAALRHRPDRFENRERWAMDWYYPVLAGAVRGEAAAARLAARWDDFVVPGLGVRCVADRPWVTVAETCELVLALDAVGRTGEARSMFGWLACLRDQDGHYWTGVTFPEAVLWPEERPTWTSAAVLLAADALDGRSPTSGLFKHAERPLVGEFPVARGEGPPVDVERRLTAVRRVGEHVVEAEEAASA